MPGEDGYYVMTDSWFTEYTYQVVVNKEYLTPQQAAEYGQEPAQLEPRDPDWAPWPEGASAKKQSHRGDFMRVKISEKSSKPQGASFSAGTRGTVVTSFFAA